MPMPVGPVHNGSGGHCHGQSAVPCNYKASGGGVPMEGEVGLFREAGGGVDHCPDGGLKFGGETFDVGDDITIF